MSDQTTDVATEAFIAHRNLLESRQDIVPV